MAQTCLLPEMVNQFKQDLKDKTLDISKLLNMTSEARTSLFEQYAGPEAKTLNTLFEEKLVLKNRVQGLKNWAAQAGEFGRYDPNKAAQIKQLLSEYRAKQQERIFSPAEHEAFLADLAEAKMGTLITRAEAKNVFELSQKTSEIFDEHYDATKEEWNSPQAEAEYGAAKVIEDKYTDALKTGELSVKDLIKKTIHDTKAEWGDNKPKAVADLLLKGLKLITDNSIGLVATLDDSFIGRQGLLTLFTHPTKWFPSAGESLKTFAGTIGGKNMEDALQAKTVARPNYINGAYRDAGILPKTEEQFPTALPARIPGVGRVFRASEGAFKNSAIVMRTGLFDLLEAQAKKNGIDTKSKEWRQDTGKVVNSLSARGAFKGDSHILVRLALWAPKMLKAHWDVLTAHTFGTGLKTGFARREAAINLVKVITTAAAIIQIANAISPGSAETDPRSSNFGKIKVGNTTYDFTGGTAGLVVLATKLITGQTKGANGTISQLDSGKYGAATRFDTVINFLTNKTPPPTHTVIDLLRGKMFDGSKPTLKKELLQNFTPITIQNMLDLKDDASVSAILGVILDGFGLNSSTYDATASDWSQDPGVELQAFQKAVGADKFEQANEEYNNAFGSWLETVQKDPQYIALPEESKQRLITNKKSSIKAQTFLKYGFTYHKAAPVKLPKL